ncbi:hypothetical protein [Actinoplanes sp. NPDC051494]|uniref:hypothetical protein n=1 Tax=Actinoplanes sp. NPDC051494 TaxID=3363907 RepID=UPI0037AC16E6
MIARVLRWVSLAVAVTSLVVFLVAQRQTADVSYGRSPAPDAARAVALGESDTATVPSVAELTALLAADPVVRLPGSVARWDEARVRAVAGSGLRILVAPPGLDDAERKRVRDVETADVTVIGTEVSGGGVQAAGGSLADWRIQFGAADVTNQLVAVIAHVRDQPAPDFVDTWRWRDPTPAQIDIVVAELRKDGFYAAAGTTATEGSETAFPGGLYVVLPRQDESALRYGPALTAVFPDTPIIVVYGDWIEYHGPHADEFAEVAAVSFYAQFGDRLSRFAYPQQNVLTAYLNRVTDVRYAGIFDRPLPYRPTDPLRVALPVLPWLFVAGAVLFFALSLRTLLRPPRRRRSGGLPARLAGLTALAVEMSALTDRTGDPALTRAIASLTAARSALDDNLPDATVRPMVAEAESQLDMAARTLPYPGYRPDDYLRGRLT